TTPQWLFQDDRLNLQEITLERPLDAEVMEHDSFKVAFRAQFHAQTPLQAGAVFDNEVKNRLEEIKVITITSHESAIRIIDITEILHKPADRDHCLQYITAIALIKGHVTAEDYEDDVAQDPLIDQLRAKMVVQENPQYTKDYLDADKRSIA